MTQGESINVSPNELLASIFKPLVLAQDVYKSDQTNFQ